MNKASKSKDSLGDRMKKYENVFRFYLPSRSYVILRLDGAHFHTYTKGCKKPFDDKLMSDMDQTAMILCKEIQNAKFAYVQSDEISILLSDRKEINTSAWFDNNIQKIVSVSASLATANFNQLRPGKLACFDARTFIVPDLTEVANYFKWRSDDCSKNSLQMYARSLYSAKDLHKIGFEGLHNLIHAKGKNWNDLDNKYKRGRLIVREKMEIKMGENLTKESVYRNLWVSKGLEDFSFKYWFDIANKYIEL